MYWINKWKKEGGNTSLSLMRSLSIMRQLGPGQCFLPKQAWNYNSSHSSQMLAIGTKWLRNHYPQWLHPSPTQDPRSHKMVKSGVLTQRQNFWHIAKLSCKYIFVGEDSFMIIIRTDTSDKWECGLFQPPIFPSTYSRQPESQGRRVRRTGFWILQTWTWILVPPVTLQPWGPSPARSNYLCEGA